MLAGSNLQVASRSFQYRHGTQVRLRQLQLEGPAQTMFRGIVFCESPIVLQGKCKKPVLNETPLIKWSLIILRLTHIQQRVSVLHLSLTGAGLAVSLSSRLSLMADFRSQITSDAQWPGEKKGILFVWSFEFEGNPSQKKGEKSAPLDNWVIHRTVGFRSAKTAAPVLFTGSRTVHLLFVALSCSEIRRLPLYCTGCVSQ